MRLLENLNNFISNIFVNAPLQIIIKELIYVNFPNKSEKLFGKQQINEEKDHYFKK